MASSELRGRVRIACQTCGMVLWSKLIVVHLVAGANRVDEVRIAMFADGRKAIDDHRAFHILHDGDGPLIDVWWLPDDAGWRERVNEQ